VETTAVTSAEVLLTMTLALPLAMLLATAMEPARGWMPALLPIAPVPAQAAALIAPDGTSLILPQALFQLTFAIDRPGAMLLGTAALLWIAAGIYAGAWLRDRPNGGRFAFWWLMTLTGSLGVFIAADLVSFYLFFTLVSLAGYGLVAFDDTFVARRAGAVYVSFALLSEAFLLMGFVLLASASPGGSLSIQKAVAALSASPWRDPALALLILGFGVKIALVPLHVWMPLAYTAAPIPAAAALSGAAVKAGVIGLIRFLPFGVEMPGWGEGLIAVGLFSVFYGIVVGIARSNPKTVLAYSSVSQMGTIATVLGVGLATGDKSVPLVAAFYAVHHILAKGGLFLALGVAAPTKSRGLYGVLLPAAVVALGIGGLPLTGGALAKLAIKGPLGDGAVGMLVTLAAIGSTLLMLHFLRRAVPSTSGHSQSAASAVMALAWLVVAAASVAVPWTLYPHLARDGASVPEALAPKELWATLWPVLVGGLVAVGLARRAWALPRMPERHVSRLRQGAASAARNLGAAMEMLDGHLRQWPVAGVLFLALTVILAATMLVSG
jgi:formate hydrogenlyase subunit 3/multisubunit Na+/H+ antiporter MnhD subunit